MKPTLLMSFRWIPVEEGQPDYGLLVAYCRNCVLFDAKRVYDPEEFRPHSSSGITHWLPLPEIET